VLRLLWLLLLYGGSQRQGVEGRGEGGGVSGEGGGEGEDNQDFPDMGNSSRSMR